VTRTWGVLGGLACLAFGLGASGLNGVAEAGDAGGASALPVRGVAGDMWADSVLGQPGFTEITPREVVPFKVFNPGGIVVDRSSYPGRAYVWDSGNSRVLALELGHCYRTPGACRASGVLGQQSLWARSACNGDSGFQGFPFRASASRHSLCGIPEAAVSVLEHKSVGAMALDGGGNLYVADFFNHRVVRYDRPFEGDSGADAVWGQSDYAGNRCNRGQGRPGPERLCFQSTYNGGSGVAVDAGGNLWVSDGGNNRVLRFPYNARLGRPAPAADLVLGQPDFETAEPGVGLAGLKSPHGVRVTSTGHVLIADTGNDRVLVYAPGARSGQRAESTLGRDFRRPEHVEIDPRGEGVWVFNGRSGTIELWELDGFTLRHVVGAPEYLLDGDCRGPLCPSTGSFDFDADGNMLAASYGGVQDVLRFDIARPIGATVQGTAGVAHRMFSPPGGYNFESPLHPAGMGSVGGIAVWGGQLVAGDGRRVLFWDSAVTQPAGAPASGVVNARDFGSDEAFQGRMAVDALGRLWSIRAEGIDLWDLPLVEGARPFTRILKRHEPIPVLGGGAINLGFLPHDIAPVGDGSAVWVADTLNHRVVRIVDPLGSPVIDAVLGQQEPAGSRCNRGEVAAPNAGGGPAAADMLCYPGSVTLDALGNLYVGDHSIEAEGNWRLLVFAAESLSAGVSVAESVHAGGSVVRSLSTGASVALYAPPASKVFPYQSSPPAAVFKPAFDSAGRMVAGYNPYVSERFVGVYDDPLGDAVDAAGKLGDFMSLPWAAVFDDDDNLFVADSNRHRVLVYRTPLEKWNPRAASVGKQIWLPIAAVSRYRFTR
jgi:DNA-binding beta-propeller fold protein YncE